MSTLTHWLGQLGNFGALRIGRAAPEARLRVESSARLGPRHTIHAVTLGSRRWVLVCDASGTTVLPGGDFDGGAGLAGGGTSR